MDRNVKIVVGIVIVLLVIVACSVVSIAAVVLGPSVLATWQAGSDVASKTGENVDKVVTDISDDIQAATAPSATSPEVDGVRGVIAMMKADPAYNGGTIEVIGTERCINSFNTMKERGDDFTDFDKVVAVRYNEMEWYFYPLDSQYRLILLWQRVTITQTGQTAEGFQGVNTHTSTPPITQQQESYPTQL